MGWTVQNLIPGQGVIFCAYPGHHQGPSTLLYNGTGSFWGIKRLGRGTNHTPPSITGVANGLETYFCLPSVPAQACHGMTFTFTCIGTIHHSQAGSISFLEGLWESGGKAQPWWLHSQQMCPLYPLNRILGRPYSWYGHFEQKTL
jgi:hypothetical protein